MVLMYEECLKPVEYVKTDGSVGRLARLLKNLWQGRLSVSTALGKIKARGQSILNLLLPSPLEQKKTWI